MFGVMIVSVDLRILLMRWSWKAEGKGKGRLILWVHMWKTVMDGGERG